MKILEQTLKNKVDKLKYFLQLNNIYGCYVTENAIVCYRSPYCGNKVIEIDLSATAEEHFLPVIFETISRESIQIGKSFLRQEINELLKEK